MVQERIINLVDMGKAARKASLQLAGLTSEQKNAALLRIADLLDARREAIITVNKLDIDAAIENGVDPLYVRDRINLELRMDGIIADVRKVAELADPVGEVFDENVLENGLKVLKRRVPLGVLGTIYESRPNVTIDIATLALKTGNAVILRGGSDVLNTNLALVQILQDALSEQGIDSSAIQYIESTDRQYVNEMLKLHLYIDMIIPRGGNRLHDLCRENSTIPVITGGIGICHLYVDKSADLARCLPVIHNAKTQRPAVCNALDTLLVHESVAEGFLKQVVDMLRKDSVSFRADPKAYALLKDQEGVDLAGAEDFDTEWYALILGLKVVQNLDEAIEHIRVHSTQHSDGILTEDAAHAARFLNEVDSAAVYLNASTRFTDGSALGLGAEVAITTQKLHARGPMALKELTTYKWIIEGDYTSRA